MSQRQDRTIVVRVRGLPREPEPALVLLRAAIKDPKENYKATIVPSCDRLNESVALVDFQENLPPTLATLESDRLAPWQISVDDKDLSFDQNFLGFTQLYPTEGKIRADIIAICGIDGHAYGSWQGRGSLRRMWLRHFLPKDLPTCRTMIYGYKAKLSSKDSATIEDYANEFLEVLGRIRQEVPIERPIVFIAHSFGGLVIARAMVKLKHALIRKSICGLLLFAVPFRGIDVEDMSRIMDTQNHPRASLLQQLAIGSNDLKKHLNDFIDVLSGLKVVSFFETEQSRQLVYAENGKWHRSGDYVKILRAENAVLNLPEEIETRIALQSDHSGIVKFDDKYSAGYEYAIKYLQIFVKEATKGNPQDRKIGNDIPVTERDHDDREPITPDNSAKGPSTFVIRTKETDNRQDKLLATNGDMHSISAHSPRMKSQVAKSQPKEDRKCFAKLMATDPRVDRKRIEATKGDLLVGSYSWILENKQFQTWRGASGDNLLYIRGDPGKGKTMLLCGVINELSQDQDPSLAYFFCEATDDRLNTATSVLRGLIYMLADTNPSTISHIRKRFDRGNVLEGINVWWTLLEMLESIFEELANICLVVDALDECRAGREDLLNFIVRTASSTKYHVKWLVSSRNWADIRSSLHEASTLSLELNAESVSNAVVYYIHHKVTNIATKWSYREDTRAFVLDYLLKNANDTFLWVALVCTRLEKARDWKAREVLLGFPSGLDTVYEQMMKHVEESEDTVFHRYVLEVMTTVYRPISLAELRILADLPESISETEAAIMECITGCGSFLTVQANRIQFVHQSAKDYVDKYLTNQKPANSQLLHRRIFDKSIHEMSRVLKKDIYGLQDPAVDISGIEVPEMDPFLGLHYSCMYWSQHFKLAKLDRAEVLQNGIIYSFMETKFLYWLEAMSLLKSVPQALILLYELEHYIESNYSYKALSDLIHDAYRFAGYFSSIIISNPLQIYVSGYLFSPEQSAYKTSLMNEKPTWLELKIQQLDDWPPLIVQTNGRRSIPQYVAYSSDSKYIAISHARGDKTIWDAMSASLIGYLDDSPESNVDMPTSSDSSAEHTRSDVQLTSEQLNLLVNDGEPSDGQAVSNKNGLHLYKFDVAFAPDNSKLYYISKPYHLNSWSLQTYQRERIACFDPSTTLSILSSDGNHMAYIREGNVTLYKIDSKTHSRLIKENSSSFEFLAFSSNSNGLCAGTRKGCIVIWNVRTGLEIGTFNFTHGAILSLALANNLELLAVVAKKPMPITKVWILSVRTNSVRYSNEHEDCRVVFSYDDKWLVCMSRFQTDILDIYNNKYLWMMAVDVHYELTKYISEAIAFSPDCKYLAYGRET